MNEHGNRTGFAIDLDRSQSMVNGMAEFLPASAAGADGAETLAREKIERAQESDPIGSVAPANGSTAQTAMLPLLDKLGERLAFERTGTRLYDALLAKFDAEGGANGGPEREEIEEIRNEEKRHFDMLRARIEALGGDPTEVTPSANIAAVASMGLCQVVTDPRTTFQQCLDAILIAELTDNDAWGVLEHLARENGENELAEECVLARENEHVHLAKVRNWVAKS